MHGNDFEKKKTFYFLLFSPFNCCHDHQVNVFLADNCLSSDKVCGCVESTNNKKTKFKNNFSCNQPKWQGIKKSLKLNFKNFRLDNNNNNNKRRSKHFFAWQNKKNLRFFLRKKIGLIIWKKKKKLLFQFQHEILKIGLDISLFKVFLIDQRLIKKVDKPLFVNRYLIIHLLVFNQLIFENPSLVIYQFNLSPGQSNMTFNLILQEIWGHLDFFIETKNCRKLFQDFNICPSIIPSANSPHVAKTNLWTPSSKKKEMFLFRFKKKCESILRVFTFYLSLN